MFVIWPAVVYRETKFTFGSVYKGIDLPGHFCPGWPSGQRPQKLSQFTCMIAVREECNAYFNNLQLVRHRGKPRDR